MSEQIHFHLRGYRKRAGLNQKELAYLLGYVTGANVSRYENRRREINLHMALHLQAVFQTPVSDLFSDHYAKVELAVTNRARQLSAKTDCCQLPAGCHKQQFLKSLVSGQSLPAPISVWNKPKKNIPRSSP